MLVGLHGGYYGHPFLRSLLITRGIGYARGDLLIKSSNFTELLEVVHDSAS